MFGILRRLKLIYIWFKIHPLESSRDRLEHQRTRLNRLKISAWVGMRENREKPLYLTFRKNLRDIKEKLSETQGQLDKITAELDNWKMKQRAVRTEVK